MASTQYPLDKGFLIAAWLEALCYGCFFVVFFISVYIHFGFRKGRGLHNNIMFSGSVLMFIIATMHISINVFRLLRAYADFRLAPGGPVGYLGTLSRWDHIMKDTLYATQSMVGDAAAIYRCWILWNRDYRVIVLPASLLMVTIGAGFYTTDVLYAREDPHATIFDPTLCKFFSLFFSIAVIQNIFTTGLMAWRLWQGEHRIAGHRLGGSTLMPILRILVESAALYLFVEILLLATYAVGSSVQHIIIETVTPIAVSSRATLDIVLNLPFPQGLTFGLITIRINLRSQKRIANMTTEIEGSHVQTLGSMPMRRIVIGRQVDQIDDTESRYGKETGLGESEP
ncbi:hypothetical protein MVEN_01842500 [Mycena venus]|uniref:Uncharacterized protein n=1 Tax=Mycena venus TaxID=2733690 RepID=A0A8H7CP94_9AGAR|nr:hypothetical protein MVEN_01842500 [Mycena venus]